MSTDLNQVTIIGRLTRDPEARELPNDTLVADFSIAVNESFRNGKGEWEERTDFFDVTAWAFVAKAVRDHLSKGSRVIVSGKLTQHRWETPEGAKRNKVQITARTVTFMGAPEGKRDGVPPKSSAPAAAADFEVDDDLDGIPF